MSRLSGSSSKDKIHAQLELPMETRKRHFLSERREQLQQLREEASCTKEETIYAFQHRLLLNNLNVDQLEEDLGSILMFDHNLHYQLGCLIDALVHRYTKESLHDRVRTSVTIPIPIGGDKANVFTSGLRGNSNLFVIKTDAISHLECMYEYVVGKILINPLRALIPNFMYTYGYHECANYAVHEGKTLRWCNTDEPDMGYLYLEKINGVRMDEFLLTHGEETFEFAEVMLQLINALYVADVHCSFRHNDLKPENIMIRELAEPINIPFTVLGKERYIRSRWIPQILDFGISTSMYRGKKVIPSIYSNANGNRGKLFPYDIAYLLRTSSSWFRDPEKSRWRELFYLRLLNSRKVEAEQTFAQIAKVFIKIFGDHAIVEKQEGLFTLPFTVIWADGGSTDRFYQRYYQERSYHVNEYYDLINLIQEYHVSQAVSVPATASVVDIVLTTRTISDDVKMLMSSRPRGEILYVVNRELRTTLEDLLVIVDTVADYAYVLRSSVRIVLPLARKHKLISAKDEKCVQDITARVSNIYQELVKEVQELYPATERAFLRAGYDNYMYDETMRELALKIALLPRLEDM